MTKTQIPPEQEITPNSVAKLVDELNRESLRHQGDDRFLTYPFQYLYAHEEHYVLFEDRSVWNSDEGQAETIDEVREDIVAECSRLRRIYDSIFRWLPGKHSEAPAPSPAPAVPRPQPAESTDAISALKAYAASPSSGGDGRK